MEAWPGSPRKKGKLTSRAWMKKSGPFIFDDLVKSRNSIEFVIPAKAGIQLFQDVLDPGFRRGDDLRDFLRLHHIFRDKFLQNSGHQKGGLPRFNHLYLNLLQKFFCGSTSSPRTEKLNNFNLSPFTLSCEPVEQPKGKLRTFARSSSIIQFQAG